MTSESPGLFGGPQFTLTSVEQSLRSLTAAKHFIDASFCMLVYDHVLTFSDEVERIWKAKFTGASLLFMINRYFTPLQYIVNIVSFHDLAWTEETKACERFIKFPGAGTICSIAIIEIILITRTFALYGAKNYILLALLLALFVTQMTIMGVALSMSHPVFIPRGLSGCILTGSNSFFAAFWIAPLVMDSVIFVLTLWKTHKYLRQNVRTPLITILRRDGILYFTVIFGANLLNVLIYLIAPDNIKAIGASFSQLVTTVMISRLQLNLRCPQIQHGSHSRTLVDSDEITTTQGECQTEIPIAHRSPVSTNFFSETLRSLGQPFASSEEDVWVIEDELTADVPLTAISQSTGVSDTPTAVDLNTLFPPPGSRQSDDDLAGVIAVSPALIDGPDGPMLYEEWKRRGGTSYLEV